MADFSRLNASIDALTVAVDRAVVAIGASDQPAVDAAAERVEAEVAKIDAAVPPVA